MISIIKQKLNNNSKEKNIITDVRTYKEFKELNKMKIILLIPTVDKKLQMNKIIINKVIKIINHSKKLKEAIEKLKKENLILPLEELNTILTVYYTNQDKLDNNDDEITNVFF